MPVKMLKLRIFTKSVLFSVFLALLPTVVTAQETDCFKSQARLKINCLYILNVN